VYNTCSLWFKSGSKPLGIYPFVSKLIFAKSPQTIEKSEQKYKQKSFVKANLPFLFSILFYLLSGNDNF